MIVRSLQEIIGTEREVRGPGWNSRRLVLARERAGFSVNDTVVDAGAELEMSTEEDQ
ncbi:ectoine synthase [Nocardia niwae]|uniref:Ectoine synthase n=1 Tax=Nocardia niwae TaxID=626084 RepID=A0ABV2X661_9NOCA|nr:ectoine synthase [Nocardia niwae]